MSEKKNTKETNKNTVRDLIILIIAVVVLIGSVVVLLVLRASGEGKTTESQRNQVDLSALHVFPPIEFEDSLYYAKTLVSYDDENKSPRDVFYYEMDSLGQPTEVKVHETHYYPGNKKYMDGNVHNDVRDGLWYAYHKNGNVQTMAHYENGVEEGQYTVYYENGSVRYTGAYHKGKRVGVWSFYDEREKLVKTTDFDKQKK